MEKKYRFWNNIIGWCVFAIATITYLASMQQTVSWWDCGEYLSTTYKLEVSHPPGAPTYQILGRLFSLLAGGDVTKVAMMINSMSALSSSFTILFLFWSITILAKKIVVREQEMKLHNMLAIFGAGIVGALAYTFSDTFWFSAVEGEVYAMSSLCTALVFWMILRWENEADQPYSVRWIILIAYLIGLSIGVHLLNLLAIPALAYIYYYKKFDNITWKGLLITGIASILLLAIVLFLLVPWTVELAGLFELFFVNSIGLPFNSGTIIYFVLLASLLTWAIWFTHKHKKQIANTAILCVTFILIGYSSFFSIVIRANTNTPINMNEPNDALSLLSYLNREQYGSTPLLVGPYYSSPIVGYKEGSPNYLKDEENNKYYISGYGNGEYKYLDGSTTLFPRMHSTQYAFHKTDYENWAKIKGTRINYIDPFSGEKKTYIKPTFAENLRFFFVYQCNHMYWRYLMWNFSGRQNDVEGHGSIDAGNWITGFNFLDKHKIGTQDNLPPSLQNKAHNVYYMLPFILGIVGLIFYTQKDKRRSWVVFLLFFMTGFAIILYLNQSPHQPRERDYAYAGSFYAFSMWIGFGVLAIYYGLKKYINANVGAILATIIGLIVPSIMLAQNWDDHDRSDNWAAHDNGANYLNSCPQNAILYTNGDNDTYSLWYAQEVEGIRTDVRVINYLLSSGAWYCHQQLRKINDSEKLPLTLGYKDYQKGVNDQVLFIQQNGIGEISVKQAIQFISNPNNKRQFFKGADKDSWVPSKQLYIPVDKEKVAASGLVSPEEATRLVDKISFTKQGDRIHKNELLFLDLLATNDWERPICFTAPETVQGLIPNVDLYLHQTGYIYQLMPFVSETYQKNLRCGFRMDSSYHFFMNKFQNGNLNQPDVYIDRESARNLQAHRQSMQLLALMLINRNDSTRAINMMDKWIETYPQEKAPYNIYTANYCDVYFRAGDSVKGVKLLTDLYYTLKANLDYFAAQDPKIRAAYQEDIERTIACINYILIKTATQYKQDKLADEMQTYIDSYAF